jgi:dihydrofolate reductase
LGELGDLAVWPGKPWQTKETTMQELLVDFITSMDGYASAEGWPGWWGLEGPEYLRWLDEQPERDYTVLMGAKTYRLMSGFATEPPAGAAADEADTLSELTNASKVVFSSSLQTPLSGANTELASGDAIQAVRDMKQNGASPMLTIGSLSLCRSLLQAGLVDRYRVVVFPVITGSTGSERIYDGYPDVGLNMLNSRTFDGRIQLLEYAPRVLDGPPGTNPGA